MRCDFCTITDIVFCLDVRCRFFFSPRNRHRTSNTPMTSQHTTTDKEHQHNRHDTTRHDTTRHTAAAAAAAAPAPRHATPRHGTARHGTARHSTVQYSTVQYSTVQHSTAQHSTAQHSTAQHSTAHTYTYSPNHTPHHHILCPINARGAPSPLLVIPNDSRFAQNT